MDEKDRRQSLNEDVQEVADRKSKIDRFVEPLREKFFEKDPKFKERCRKIEEETRKVEEKSREIKEKGRKENEEFRRFFAPLESRWHRRLQYVDWLGPSVGSFVADVDEFFFSLTRCKLSFLNLQRILFKLWF